MHSIGTRAAAAGIGGFYTPTGVGTVVAEGKERRTFDGREYLLERPLRADFALVYASRADTWGNLVYDKTTRNFGPMMCAAGDVRLIPRAGDRGGSASRRRSGAG